MRTYLRVARRSHDFAMHLQDAKHSILTVMAALLALPASAADHLLATHRPQLSRNPTAVTIGRAHLPCDRRAAAASALASAASGTASRAGSFAHTGHAARLLESVGVAVAAAEPLLLVGEAGTGKTALLQHLAAQVRSWHGSTAAEARVHVAVAPFGAEASNWWRFCSF